MKKIKNNMKKIKNYLKQRNDNLKILQEGILENNKILAQFIKEQKNNHPKFDNLKKKTNKFSIVTAAYNNEKFIDDYFLSLLKQDIDFEKNIEVIYVDDGSTDNSKEKINFWVNEFPNNITYVYQENTGQSKARNNGIQYTSNQWVTFIDGDDFISKNYFSVINEAINNYPDIYLFATNMVFFHEAKNTFSNNHPLSHKFQQSMTLFNLLEEPKKFQMSMSTAVFNAKLIKSLDLKIRNYKPVFEDAFFVNEYLLKTKEHKYVTLRDAKYFYRKREEQNSTLDISIKSKEFYVENLNAYDDLLKLYNSEYNNVPEYVQNVVLYSLYWNIKLFDSKNGFELSTDELEERKHIFSKIFENISLTTIEKYFSLYWKLNQIGFYNKYYTQNKDFIPIKAYIHHTSLNFFKIKLVSSNQKWEIFIDDKKIDKEKISLRTLPLYLNKEIVAYEQMITLPIKYSESKITFKYLNHEINPIGKFHFKKPLNKDSIILFFDREDKADDNAEALYSWWAKHHPEYNNIFFVIKKSANDWNRLENSNFNLIDYGSKEFNDLYIKSDFIFSSACDLNIENYNKLRYPSNKSNAQFFFLQHGITTDNLSGWLNNKRIDGLIIGSNFEKKHMFTNPYVFSDYEKFETGFFRYDLLNNKNNYKNEILYMPTWRLSLENLTSSQFKETETFKKFISFLTNVELIKILNSNNINLIFILHPKLNRYENLFKEEITSDNIILKNSGDIIYRDYLLNCRAAITDYSSVVLDVAVQKKSILYYQFDEVDFFKTHTYDKLLDYKNDGLGKVLHEEDYLIKEISLLIKNDFLLEDKYKKRIEEFFIINKSNREDFYNKLINTKTDISK